MQITSIQNIIRNNFQYKNNPIKFNHINFKGQDTFERKTSDDVVVSKKYHRGKEEYPAGMFIQSGNRLFIKSKDSFIPYGASLDEFNSKGELIKCTSFNNGAKYIVSHYKNQQIIQQDRYEYTFGSVIESNKKTGVAKFEGVNETGKKPLLSFAITRNYGKGWENHPTIIMRKNSKNDSLFVYFATSADDKRGEIEINYTNKDKTFYFQSPIYDEKDFELKTHSLESINETAYLALIELKETLESEEFKADFGSNDKLNSDLDKAIEVLSSILNED